MISLPDGLARCSSRFQASMNLSSSQMMVHSYTWTVASVLVRVRLPPTQQRFLDESCQSELAESQEAGSITVTNSQCSAAQGGRNWLKPANKHPKAIG
jgi:hypothetical protein